MRAWPKASWSISSCRSIATHAPETTSSGRGRPHTLTMSGSEKGRMRADGAKRTSSARDSRGRRLPSSAPPPRERCTWLGFGFGFGFGFGLGLGLAEGEVHRARRERGGGVEQRDVDGAARAVDEADGARRLLVHGHGAEGELLLLRLGELELELAALAAHLGEMQGRCGGGAGEMQGRCRGGAGEMQGLGCL